VQPLTQVHAKPRNGGYSWPRLLTLETGECQHGQSHRHHRRQPRNWRRHGPVGRRAGLSDLYQLSVRRTGGAQCAGTSPRTRRPSHCGTRRCQHRRRGDRPVPPCRHRTRSGHGAGEQRRHCRAKVADRRNVRIPYSENPQDQRPGADPLRQTRDPAHVTQTWRAGRQHRPRFHPTLERELKNALLIVFHYILLSLNPTAMSSMFACLIR